ncbi:hypothetical protein B0H10DRAFT_2249831 [Mycena sp. CBHHK59/15]|nr:hypothetical protein B0H10DRAFT_2249831 [Mycena sp. CBHHK59/15]
MEASVPATIDCPRELRDIMKFTGPDRGPFTAPLHLSHHPARPIIGSTTLSLPDERFSRRVAPSPWDQYDRLWNEDFVAYLDEIVFDNILAIRRKIGSDDLVFPDLISIHNDAYYLEVLSNGEAHLRISGLDRLAAALRRQFNYDLMGDNNAFTLVRSEDWLRQLFTHWDYLLSDVDRDRYIQEHPPWSPGPRHLPTPPSSEGSLPPNTQSEMGSSSPTLVPNEETHEESKMQRGDPSYHHALKQYTHEFEYETFASRPIDKLTFITSPNFGGSPNRPRSPSTDIRSPKKYTNNFSPLQGRFDSHDRPRSPTPDSMPELCTASDSDYDYSSNPEVNNADGSAQFPVYSSPFVRRAASPSMKRLTNRMMRNIAYTSEWVDKTLITRDRWSSSSLDSTSTNSDSDVPPYDTELQYPEADPAIFQVPLQEPIRVATIFLRSNNKKLPVPSEPSTPADVHPGVTGDEIPGLRTMPRRDSDDDGSGNSAETSQPTLPDEKEPIYGEFRPGLPDQHEVSDNKELQFLSSRSVRPQPASIVTLSRQRYQPSPLSILPVTSPASPDRVSPVPSNASTESIDQAPPPSPAFEDSPLRDLAMICVNPPEYRPDLTRHSPVISMNSMADDSSPDSHEPCDTFANDLTRSLDELNTELYTMDTP